MFMIPQGQGFYFDEDGNLCEVDPKFCQIKGDVVYRGAYSVGNGFRIDGEFTLYKTYADVVEFQLSIKKEIS